MDDAHDAAWLSEVAAAYEENKDALHRVAKTELFDAGLAAEASDIVSTAISEVLHKGRRPVENWQAYLVTVVQRRAVDFLRSAAIRRRDDREIDLNFYADDTNAFVEVDEGIDTLALIARATDALNSLESRQRDVAFAHFWQGRSQAEIAAELGISQPRVSQIIQEARSSMKAYIEGGEH